MQRAAGRHLPSCEVEGWCCGAGELPVDDADDPLVMDQQVLGQKVALGERDSGRRKGRRLVAEEVSATLDDRGCFWAERFLDDEDDSGDLPVLGNRSSCRMPRPASGTTL